MLRRVGYTRMVERGLKSQRPDFPDLKTEKAGVAPTSDRVAYAATVQKPRVELPVGFVIGNSHKQGLELMPVSELPWAGGKKS